MAANSAVNLAPFSPDSLTRHAITLDTNMTDSASPCGLQIDVQSLPVTLHPHQPTLTTTNDSEPSPNQTPTMAKPGLSHSGSATALGASRFDADLGTASPSIPQSAHAHTLSAVSTHQNLVNMDLDAISDKDLSDQEDPDSVLTSRLEKKQKGQRFYCTDFPPCTLSFTRSEHLSRHIRKHTGERPFVCHCERRFSRLDNLRQHAQTVHLNEDIPIDSLAASGSRTQRPVFQDKPRPHAGRSRASTVHSIAGPSRNHARTLSSSSVASSLSTVSTLLEESRKRPISLVMSHEEASPPVRIHSSFSPNTAHTSFQHGYAVPHPQSSALRLSTRPAYPFTFSDRSPTFLARPGFETEQHAHSRRLSVPSSVAPILRPSATASSPSELESPQGRRTLLSSIEPQPCRTGQSSLPLGQVGAAFSHRRSESEAELDWRRRTWHSGAHAAWTSRRATSGLAYQQTLEESQPDPQSAASQITRLPGIASFDHAPSPEGAIPIGHLPSPSTTSRPGHARIPSLQPTPTQLAASRSDDKRNYPLWEAGLHHNLDRLDITNSSPGEPNSRPSSHSAAFGPGVNFGVVRQQDFARVRSAATQVHSRDDDYARGNRRQGGFGSTSRPTSRPVSIFDRPASATSSSEGILTPGTSYEHDAQPTIVQSYVTGSGEMPPPFLSFTQAEDKQHLVSPYYTADPARSDSAASIYQLPVMTDSSMPPPPPTHRTGMERLETLASVVTAQTSTSPARCA